MRAYFIPLVLFMSSISVFAQTDDPVIMTVNDKDFKKSEFEYFYHKYSEDAVDKLSLNDYVDLFKNLKLKVAEATTQGMDTASIFLKELSEYRVMEANPYLTELEIDEEIIKTKFNRMKEMVEISHILFAFPKVKNKNDFKIFPSDTIETYNNAILARDRLLKGENFEKVALELSDDANVSEMERPGYLGWFAGLMLNIPFEDVVFNTPIGQITQPIRTNHGYYIVKIHAKKEYPDQINAAHILILCPPDADAVQHDDAKRKINEIYNELTNGADFSTMAKEHSKDQGSASKGGELGWFGNGAMIKDFHEVAYDLKEIGEISKPFKTQFGYHIVKLLGRRPLPFDEKSKEIESKMKFGGYLFLLHHSGIERMKKEYGFQTDNTGYQQLLSKANTVYPTDDAFYTFFDTQEIPLFTIGDTKYYSSQFIDYLKMNTHSPFTLSTELLNDRLQWFEYGCLNGAEDKSLEEKYPEFRNLIQEYRDGTLMYEVSNKEVWEKASEDTEGLTAFFNRNKQRYVWNEPHYNGYVILVKDNKTKKKMQKEISKKDPDTAVQYLYDNYKVGDVSYVKIERGLFKKGDNAFVDEAAFKSGSAGRTQEFNDFFLLGKVMKAPESYMDIRGEVVADYQNFLEEIWIKQLNEKYKVTVYPEVVNTIK